MLTQRRVTGDKPNAVNHIGAGAGRPRPEADRRSRDRNESLSRAVKRGLDIAVASAGLVASLPAMALVAAAVYLNMGRPILFTQVRPGYRGRPFRLLKFRTMRDDRAPDGSALPDAERLTRLGRFLRRTSLDELPQLLNILRGDMSLVGPRPLLPEYLPLYTSEQARRHTVRPGLTGWSQVRGRNAASWGERLADDVWYVENRSLALDLKIMAMTIKRVIAGTGVSARGEATMPRFRGTAGDSR